MRSRFLLELTTPEVGAVGSFMQDPRHHACPSEYVSLERGLAFFDRQVAQIAPILVHIDQYVKDTESQHNRGWWSLDEESA